MIDDHVRFWCGDVYDLLIQKKWQTMQDLMKKTQFGKHVKKYLTIHDKTEENVRSRYGTEWGHYRFRIAGEVMQEIARHTTNPSENIHYPILMVDAIGANGGGLITYTRMPTHRKFVLWPLSYHEHSNLIGLDDPYDYDDKDDVFFFRGACSSPKEAVYFQDLGHYKPSRFEIVQKNHHLPWTDLGVSKPELHDNDPEVVALVRPPVSPIQQMKHRFILCIEGADISTSFGWVLASNSVPIHTYPFIHEVWYFQGLEPWVHFIPMDARGDDLETVKKWCDTHPDDCKRIAHNGRDYMSSLIRITPHIKKAVADLWTFETPPDTDR